MKVRQAIRAEALSFIAVGVPDTELDKNLYGVVSVEAQAANSQMGSLEMVNGILFVQRLSKGSISGTTGSSFAVARGVLRRSHDIAMSD